MPLRVLAVSSGKGGVGKTNVVANLAHTLCKRGKKVLVVDADLGLNNIDILLGMSPEFHIGDVLSGQKTVHEILVRGPGNIHVLPAGDGLEELTQLDNAQRMVLMDQLDHESDQFDFLIFDTGAGISSNVTYFCSAAQEILLVSTPEPTSITDVYALMKVLHKNHDQKHFRLIINSVKSEMEAQAIFRNISAVTDRFLKSIMLEYLGFILQDSNVPRAVRQQRPFAELYPYSRASICINGLTDKIMNEDPNPAESEQTFFWRNAFQVQ